MDVLIVEDEAKLADVIARNLRAHDFRVSVAATAEDALTEMEETRPDALVIDVNLPDLTGWDLLRKLPMDQGRPPVVVMSAGPISPQRIDEFRPERHIEKPFPMDALIRILTELGSRDGRVLEGADNA